LLKLVGTGYTQGIGPVSVNILGDFNIAGEVWIIRDYFEKMGVQVVATITGDGRVDDIRRAHGAALNLVQCSGSMMHLATPASEERGIPFKRVSYFGIEDMAQALYDAAGFFAERSPASWTGPPALVRRGTLHHHAQIDRYRRKTPGPQGCGVRGRRLQGLFAGPGVTPVGNGHGDGGFADRPARRLRRTAQLVRRGDHHRRRLHPLELSSFLQEKQVDLFIGGVKERPIAYKLGVGFCDHNHERKEPLAGFTGMLNFAREVYNTVASPVWKLTPRGRKRELSWS